MLRRGWLGLAVAALGAGCASQGLSGGQFPIESIAVPDEASTYLTDARPDGVLGGPGVERVQARLLKKLAARGDRAEADGALGATACWALREVHRRNRVDSVSAELASRHYGFSGVVRGAMAFDTRADDFVGDQLERLPRNMSASRYGICGSPSGNSAAIVLGDVQLSYEPIARAFEPGQSVSLRGQLGTRYATAHVYLTKPDGSVEDRALPGRKFELVFPLTAPGRYRLEVMGDGEDGPEIASNVPLYVGVAEPPIAGVANTALDPEQTEARLLVLLNEARRAARLAPLSADPELREIALGHATDMADHHFFSHVSPSTGTPDERARRSGALLAAFGENLANAATPEEAHEGLMSSPGHRANMLRADFTHVGIAAREADAGMMIAMNFGRRPSVTALPTSAAQVNARLSELRASKGLPALSADPIYNVAAQAAAEAWASGADQAASNEVLGRALQREVDRLRTSRPGACTVFTELLELEQLKDLRLLSETTARRVGVGARLKKDGKGARLATVLMIEAATCQ
jgi:uncharacterized protein YkwD